MYASKDIMVSIIRNYNRMIHYYENRFNLSSISDKEDIQYIIECIIESDYHNIVASQSDKSDKCDEVLGEYIVSLYNYGEGNKHKCHSLMGEKIIPVLKIIEEIIDEIR